MKKYVNKMTAMLDYNEMVASMVILANIRRHLEMC